MCRCRGAAAGTTGTYNSVPPPTIAYKVDAAAAEALNAQQTGAAAAALAATKEAASKAAPYQRSTPELDEEAKKRAEVRQCCSIW